MPEIKNKVQYFPVSELKPHPDNPRLIKDEAFKKLCKSVRENPDYFETRPILLNPDKVVFAGNMRLRAAIECGLTHVPGVLMDVSEEKQRELMIRDNVAAGEWDPAILGATFETSDLEDWGVDMGKFGVFEEPGNLTGEGKGKPATMKISFETATDLETAKGLIEQTLKDLNIKTTISVSAGDL